MRARFIFLVLALTVYSCGPITNNRLSDTDKGRIQGKLKEIVKSEFDASDGADYEAVMKPFYSSSDFTYIINGITLNYKDFSDGIRKIFDSLKGITITVVNEKFTFLSGTTVLYTANCKILENFKDGHSSLNDPAAILFIFKRIDHNWKIIYGVQSYIKQPEKEKNITSQSIG